MGVIEDNLDVAERVQEHLEDVKVVGVDDDDH